MSVFEEFVKVNRLKKKDVAEYLNVSAAFITQLVQGVRSVPEDSIALIKANDRWDTSMFEDNNYSNMNNSVGGYIDHNTPENNLSSMQSVPYEFVQALFEERKRSDEQRIELLRQNGKLIDTLHANKEKNSTAGAV